MAISDKARDFWDRISPRERMLVLFLGVAVPIIIAIWLGLAIRDGLVAMEDRNDKTREALKIVEKLKASGPTEPVDDTIAKMGTEPLALETYVSNAAKKGGLTFKGPIDSRPKVTRNGFVTTTVACSLDNVTTDELKAFLQEVEMGNKVVAVTHIDIRRDFREKKKIDATFEISTYSKEKTSASGEGSGSSSSGSADKKKGG
jgi:type II secretory pathway component PulM